MLKAEQARAYEAMKGQFEGLLGRLQVRNASAVSEGSPYDAMCLFLGVLHPATTTAKFISHYFRVVVVVILIVAVDSSSIMVVEL